MMFPSASSGNLMGKKNAEPNGSAKSKQLSLQISTNPKAATAAWGIPLVAQEGDFDITRFCVIYSCLVEQGSNLRKYRIKSEFLQWGFFKN
ncbi:hypothetical protein [uncultured Fibrobacter sp.]|uniref:hypothetical protein n=2 Tax=Fibrobacter TaxID=832 RepID=UPI001B2DC1B7|nr:hypothetical protein [uncultured Fibrobacter sp.]MBO7061719.1 hypothetical protein [Fibrobacter sp.]MBO7105380.1 hypothetical protein [Fibrobacter sp.]